MRKKPMIQVLDDARDRFGDIARVAARHADDGAHYALERARTERVSWGMVAGALGVGFVTAFALLTSKKAANTAATAISGDWFEGLNQEYRRIEKLLKQIVDTTDAQAARRTRLLEALNAAITRHTLQKENVLYPAVRGADQGAASTHLAAELFEIKTYLYELEDMAKDDARWLRKAKALQRLVSEHVEGEQEALAAFRDNLAPTDAQRLTRAMHREALKLA